MEERFQAFTVLITGISRSIHRIKTEEMSEFELRSSHVSCLYYLFKENELTAKELCDKYTEELYRVYYKNDILISGSLADSDISPVTAYACGLTDHLDRNNSIFYFGQ